ncbi:alpha/beta hydrolase [Pseudooceanicola sp. CBS1P-1]|uniref:Alpha/beta hydrolase n=1 Tax=Pseudooceanicola albus TaxID=2692189 RepID=A0A6L7G4L9_9RHOB|nr:MULTISPECIES: alpha/beta family hydrolase [Pseudooceanicola]MBT9384665.1 alpha/beta hydrolase [Pseudooceanicola endophyticus]MXN18366.1 alpha/beta hydrolase [Pseudooceanicola albus]
MTDVLLTGDLPGRPTLLLAHGAGAAMDTPFMSQMAEGLAARGLRVARFEFAYMAGRRSGGAKRPPPKVALLEQEYRAAIDALPCDGPLLIGGKSMGGRVASLIAQDLHAEGRIAGLVCLGYPFHPTGKPENLRTAHLAGLTCPTLICQGSRDPFGTRAEVATYALSPAITLHWLEDGNHDLAPRKSVTGLTQAAHLASAAGAIADWAARLT